MVSSTATHCLFYDIIQLVCSEITSKVVQINVAMVAVALMSAVDEDGFHRTTYGGEDKGRACASHVLLAATVMLLDFLCFKTVEDGDYCC